MKKVTGLFLVMVVSLITAGQKVYFVYVQSENQQPFYARLGERVYNSSASGYLILSKLRDSTYTMNIGLQGNAAPDQPFSIMVNRKDQGFLLKNFGDKGWGLFNLQTLNVLMPSVNNAANLVKTEKREANEFTDLLAKASDDSTIREKPVIVKVEEKKEESGQELKDTAIVKIDAVKKEEPPVEKKEEIKTEPPVEKKEKPEVEVKELSVIKTEVSQKDTVQLSVENDIVEKSAGEVYKRSTVIRRSEGSTTEGFGLIFWDISPDGKTDTIKVLIPNETKKVVPAEVKPEEKKFLDVISSDTIQKRASGEKKEVVSQPVSQQETTKPVIVKKNDCPLSATEDDFFKLRKKMAGENSDNDMIIEAKKLFKTKCFTTQQLRNLSSMFLSDEGKYKFFDVAYSYVSDIENFALLLGELKDGYFINRFKAMLH